MKSTSPVVKQEATEEEIARRNAISNSPADAGGFEGEVVERNRREEKRKRDNTTSGYDGW